MMSRPDPEVLRGQREKLEKRVACEKRMIELTERNNRLTKEKHMWEEKMIAILKDAEEAIAVDPATATKEEAGRVINCLMSLMQYEVHRDRCSERLKDIGQAMRSTAGEFGYGVSVGVVSAKED